MMLCHHTQHAADDDDDAAVTADNAAAAAAASVTCRSVQNLVEILMLSVDTTAQQSFIPLKT